MKNLTIRYSFTQFSFWAAATGASSFATVFLLQSGLSAGRIGTLLAMAGLLSCILQPLLAGILDRCAPIWLPRILIFFSFLCAGCFGILLLPDIPVTIVGLCYMAGICFSDIMVPLLNALSVSCGQAGYAINYGAARGIGSAASAISALVLGHVIDALGHRWMLLLLIGFRFLYIAILAGYPALSAGIQLPSPSRKRSSVFSFFIRYPWYCLSLTGILFLGMYHAMTENYLIAILGRLGGNSSHVGTALFLSSMAGAPVIFCFQHIRKRLSNAQLLKIAACSFLLKSLLICFAKSIPAIYCIELLQMTSYAFLAPTQVTYAQEKVCAEDMVKGQAFSTAAYALGCSAGNFAGGQLLPFGIDILLAAGVIMALLGTIILFATVCRSDLSALDS